MIWAEGSWMTHAQHGGQFKIEQCSRMLPTSAEAIYEYLAGGTVARGRAGNGGNDS